MIDKWCYPATVNAISGQPSAIRSGDGNEGTKSSTALGREKMTHSRFVRWFVFARPVVRLMDKARRLVDWHSNVYLEGVFDDVEPKPGGILDELLNGVEAKREDG